MNMIFRYFTVCLIALFTVSGCHAQSNPAITIAELKQHVAYLASQELGGRFPGTAGDLAAARYIATRFRDYGLHLYENEGFQSFSIKTGIRKGPENRLLINGRQLTLDQDFMPLSISGNGLVSGSMVFCGYGFSIKSDSMDWDDYKEIDVKGRIAVLLLGAPEPTKGAQADPFESYGSIRSKILNAKDKGVIGLIFVAGPGYDDKDELEFGTIKENAAGLPVIRVKRKILEQILGEDQFKTSELESKLNVDKQPLSRILEGTATIQTDLITTTSETRNVIAWIPGETGGIDKEWVVVGAHYDHLGMGGIGSNSRVQDTVAVHPGADDNASGVSSIIEIAGELASHKPGLKRSVMFVAFTGEEMGILGSKYFMQHSPIPAGKITAMVNLDMVGRLGEEKRLSVGGVGTAVELDSILGLVDHENLVYAKSQEGYGPSDHASFYTAGIPVLYFSTGAHLDYHTPGDVPDKLTYGPMKEIAGQVAEIITIIANAPQKVTFREAGPRTNDSGRRKLKVTFGIMPDVSGTENNGLRVEFVTPGKPAHQAGILKGDRIVGINGLPVTNVYDYMSRLQQLKPGQTVSVELIRDEKKIVVLVQL